MQYQAERATLAARLPHPSLVVSEFLLRMLRIAPFALPASEHANLRAAARPALTCAGHFPERRHTPRCLRHGTITCCSADNASPKSPPSRSFARSSEAPRANTASTSPHAMITRQVPAEALQNRPIPLVASATQDFTAAAYASLGPLNLGIRRSDSRNRRLIHHLPCLHCLPCR